MLSPAAHKIQPIGFPGRRATIRAPTVENANRGERQHQNRQGEHGDDLRHTQEHGRGRYGPVQGRGQEDEHQRERPHRPSQPRCNEVAHRADSSTLFACPYCHDFTLPYHRLPSVKANVVTFAF
jgi:hypothetical protein